MTAHGTAYGRVAHLVPLLILIPMLHSGAALAQVERNGGGVNAQLYQSYQEALAQRTQLQSDNAKLKSDLDAARKQLAALKQDLAAAKAGTATSKAEVAAAQAAQAGTAKSLELLKGQAQQLVDRFRETIASLKGVELERTQLQRDLAQSKAAFDQCAIDNDKLYQVDSEVLDRYAHQGAFSYMARAEPFTRIERTRIGNLSLEYRERAEALRVQSQTGATPAAATAPLNVPAPANPTTPGSTGTQSSSAVSATPPAPKGPGQNQ